jgi:hypothetical protein
MISEREIERIKRQMDDLTYFSIETEILEELIQVYQQVNPPKRQPPIPKPPDRNRKTDD